MKTISFLLGLFLSLSLLAQNNCVIESSFNYVIEEGQVIFDNTSESLHPDVEIVNYVWDFSTGYSTYQEDFIYYYYDLCDFDVCLTIYADSLGMTMGNCWTSQVCQHIELGLPPMNVEWDLIYHEESESVTVTPIVTGSDGNISYWLDWEEWSIGTEVSYTLPFNGLQSMNVEIGMEDANGCIQTEQLTIINPYFVCDIDFNLIVNENLISLDPVLTVGGEIQENVAGQFIFSNDSIYSWYPNNPWQMYYPILGESQVCFELNPWELPEYPSCHETVCETFELDTYANNCNAIFSMYGGDHKSFWNQSSGYYTSLIWDFGNGITSDEDYVLVDYAPGVYTVTLTVSNELNGCESVYSETFEVFEDIQFCVEVFNDLDRDSEWDTNEPYLNDVVVELANYYWELDTGLLVDSIYPDSYVMGVYSNTHRLYASRIPSNLSGDMIDGYFLDCVPNEDACPNVFGMFVTEQGTCGRFYVDLNFNHELDNDEPGVAFAEILVEYEGYSEIVTCDVQGYFCITIPYGSVTVQPLINGEPSMSVYPDNVSGSYDTMVIHPPSYLFFGWIPPQDLQDVQISMSPLGAPVPGFVTDYVVHVNNASSEDHAIQVNVTIDAMQEVSSVSNNGTESDSGVTWDLIIPAYGFLDLSFSVSNGLDLNLGDQISSWAVVQITDGFSDSNLDNNVVQLDMQVVGSYDPNNKLSNPAGVGPLGLISPSVNSIEYTINFQNTGTAPAVNIEVVDELPALLDPSSIELLHTSYPASMSVQGQNVKWNFYNIMLADSMTNEPESHGHITFRIAPTNPLVNGQTISNEAYIYFDFNAPIITAPAVLTVDETIGVANVEPGTSLMVYPNPVSNEDLYIVGTIGTVDIFNASGQRLQTIQPQKAPIVVPTSTLSPGLYVVHDAITGQKITFVKK